VVQLHHKKHEGSIQGALISEQSSAAQQTYDQLTEYDQHVLAGRAIESMLAGNKRRVKTNAGPIEYNQRRRLLDLVGRKRRKRMLLMEKMKKRGESLSLDWSGRLAKCD
jgi:hypothetical protein